jgi:hypothetical protein
LFAKSNGVLYGQEAVDPVLMRIGLNIVSHTRGAMNLFQRVNIAASLAVVGVVASSLFRAITELKPNESLLAAAGQYVNPLLLALFILVFKVKTMLDDHQHFGEERQKRGGFRHLGFLFALFSWLFWIVAAYFVFSPTRAAELMIFSIAISTGWIAVHLIEMVADKRRNQEIATSLMREKWVLFNVGYIILLGVFLGWIKPVVQPQTTAPLVILLAFFVFDYVTSKSYPTDNIG